MSRSEAMTGISRWGYLLALVALAAAAPSRAQVPSADTSKAIVIKTLKPSTAKLAKFPGDVLSSTSQSITVRSRDHEQLIRTFTYAANIRDKMQQILDQGGYQYGDKVEIDYQPGTDVALLIKGKPSKPL
jgi:hypothetical protein